MRKACVCRIRVAQSQDVLFRGTDHVACAADRMQQRRLEALVDLGAQAGDMHVDHIGLRIEVVFPYALQEHGAGHYLARMAHQILQKTELARLQVDRLAVAGGRPGEQVQFKIADRKLGLHGGRSPATH